MKATSYEFGPRKGRGMYEILIARAGSGGATTVVQVTESPTGRSVQVHINGERVR